MGVDRTAFERRPDEWRRVLDEGELPDGERRVVDVDSARVLVGRTGGVVYALANRCSHRGGPLDEGTFEGGCITCPWHGSTFRLADGSVVRGAAAYPQPVYAVRAEGGGIEVRARPV